MRSRSYYAIAGSSLLLLTIACQPNGKRDAKRVDPTVKVIQTDPIPEDVHDPTGDEKKAGDEKGDGDSGEPHGTDGGEEGTSGHPAAADGGDAPPEPEDGKGKDGCRKGHMPFEGKCVSKDRVGKILEKREEEALAKVHDAKKPKQTAQASYDLIEQQTQQIEKVEDDLDEIIEQLEKEREAKEKAEKGGEGGP